LQLKIADRCMAQSVSWSHSLHFSQSVAPFNTSFGTGGFLLPTWRGSRLAGDSSSSSCRHQSQHRGHITPPPASVNFAAGFTAGIATDLPLHPIDTLKTRIQAQQGFRAAGGFSGLWCGLTPVLMRSVPCSALFFVVYEHMRHSLEHHIPSAFCCGAVAGALANVTTCSVRVPCEVLKQRMQELDRNGRPARLKQIVRTVGASGIRGYYTGFGATVSRELAFALVQMPLFEELKRLHSRGGDRDKGREGAVGMMCGGVAGAIAGALTTPLDLAKTRLMLAPHGSKQQSVRSMLKVMHAEGGINALFRGAITRTTYVGISSALWLGAYEEFRAYFWCP